MKYIRLFEGYQDKFWLIRVDEPYLEYSLDKINLSEDHKKRYRGMVANKVKELGFDKFYISISNSHARPGWMLGNQHGKDYLESGPGESGIYQGEIDPTPAEINLWLIKKDTDKYNL